MPNEVAHYHTMQLLKLSFKNLLKTFNSPTHKTILRYFGNKKPSYI